MIRCFFSNKDEVKKLILKNRKEKEKEPERNEQQVHILELVLTSYVGRSL